MGRSRVKGGDLFPHIDACKAGSSGMRFDEGERNLVESKGVVQRSSTQCHRLRARESYSAVAPNATC